MGKGLSPDSAPYQHLFFGCDFSFGLCQATAMENCLQLDQGELAEHGKCCVLGKGLEELSTWLETGATTATASFPPSCSNSGSKKELGTLEMEVELRIIEREGNPLPLRLKSILLIATSNSWCGINLNTLPSFWGANPVIFCFSKETGC